MLKGLVRLRLPGAHNVQNCLAVLILAEHLGVQFELTAAVISEFEGTERRFEVKGEIGGVIAVDDYAHHPTAVRATLDSARRRYGSSPLWAVFQPHTFTRTKALLDEFSTAFGEAEHVIVTDIYRARETDDLGVSSKALVKAMKHPDARHIGKLDAVVDFLARAVEPGDVVITMSAGDATRIGDDLLDALAERFEGGAPLEEAARSPGQDLYEDAAATSGIVKRLLTYLRREEAAPDGKAPSN
jgi:UDP-N-acetylmuramate--alanine ligase